jgi:autotransporter adhesin
MSGKKNINAINVNTRNFNYHTLSRDGIRGGMEWVTMPERSWGWLGNNKPVDEFGGGFNIKGSHYGTLYVEPPLEDSKDGSGNFLVFVDNSGLGHTIAGGGGGGIGYWTPAVPGGHGAPIGGGGYIRPVQDISAIIAYDYNNDNDIITQPGFWNKLEYKDSSGQDVSLDNAALIVMDKMQFLEASGNSATAAAGGLGTIRYTYQGVGGGIDPSGSSFQGKVFTSLGAKWVKFGEGSITHTQYWGESSTPFNHKLSTALTSQIKGTAIEVFPADCCGNYSLALGQDCSSGKYSLALGNHCRTVPPGGGLVQGGAVAIGANCDASGEYSVAMGSANTASGTGSVAMGHHNWAGPIYPPGPPVPLVPWGGVAMGLGNTASAIGTVAMGMNNTASASSAVAMGNNNTASNNMAVAMGFKNTASGLRAVAIGNSNAASGDWSVAMGDSNAARGDCSVAMGCNNDASGQYAVAMGQDCSASGDWSVAMGQDCSASGDWSVAMGLSNTASGDYSVALGCKADTNNNYQFVLGISNEDTASGMPTGGGNTFFIDNSQNVAMGVGGDLSFDISSVRQGVPVLDVSGDIRCRGCIDPLSLGLHVFAAKTDGEALYKTLDSSGAGMQMLFIVEGSPGEGKLYHAYTDGTGGVQSAAIGGGSSGGLWTTVDPTPSQGTVLTPDTDASGIKLKNTLIYGTDASGLMVGDGNTASGDYSVAMGTDCSANGIASFADGSGCTARGNFAVAMGTDCSAGGIASFADGSGCTAHDDYNVALGNGADASGTCGFMFKDACGNTFCFDSGGHDGSGNIKINDVVVAGSGAGAVYGYHVVKGPSTFTGSLTDLTGKTPAATTFSARVTLYFAGGGGGDTWPLALGVDPGGGGGGASGASGTSGGIAGVSGEVITNTVFVSTLPWSLVASVGGNAGDNGYGLGTSPAIPNNGGDSPSFPGVNSAGKVVVFGPVAGPYIYPGAPAPPLPFTWGVRGVPAGGWCAGGGGARSDAETGQVFVAGNGGPAMLIIEWWYMP